jgi:hypothetical protein
VFIDEGDDIERAPITGISPAIVAGALPEPECLDARLGAHESHLTTEGVTSLSRCSRETTVAIADGP